MRHTIIGVMGPGEGATGEDCNVAATLGELIAKEGWVLLTGGRSVGVMEAATSAASAAGGLTIGVLPGSDYTNASTSLRIAVLTGMGEARNNINVLTSDIVIACGMNSGTASEAALTIKARRPLILLNQDHITVSFFRRLNENVRVAANVQEAIRIARELLSTPTR